MDTYANTPVSNTSLLQRVESLEQAVTRMRAQLDQRDAEVDAKLELHRHIIGVEYNAKTMPQDPTVPGPSRY